MIDIKKIINDKVTEMVDEGVVVQTIQESVEKSIKSAIKDVLTSYRFENSIEEKLKTEIDGCLGDVDFTGYKKLMIERMLKVIADLKDDDYSQKVQDVFEKTFTKTKEVITLDEIIEGARDLFMGDKEPYEGQDEYFALEIVKSEYGWIDVKFSEEEPRKSSYSTRLNYEYEFTIHPLKGKDDTNEYKITRLKADDIEFDYDSKTISHISRLNKVQEILLNAYLNETKIIVESVDADDYDTGLWDEN